MLNNKRISVGLLGATGMVGQRLVELLRNHPYFDLQYLAASERSAGKKYGHATRWRLSGTNPIPEMDVHTCDVQSVPSTIKLVFSALDGSVAGPIEQSFKDSDRFVVSNASAWRMAPNVPLIIPEINPDHLSVLGEKPTRGIIANPNCCAIPLAMSLAPLEEAFGVESLCVSTYQAVSGAGYPGESAWDMVGNVHPHAGNEESKLAVEPQKILGRPHKAAEINISARCVRVPTADGHLLAVQVKLASKVQPEDIVQTLNNFQSRCGKLPSSPDPLFHIHTLRDRPSPRFDVMAGKGMAVSIGRIEACPVMGIKYFVLAHNTIRGAAGAALANAELLHHKSLL